MKRLVAYIVILVAVLALVPSHKVSADTTPPTPPNVYHTFLPAVLNSNQPTMVVCNKEEAGRQYGCVLLIGTFSKTLLVYNDWTYAKLIEQGKFCYEGKNYSIEGGTMMMDDFRDYSGLYTNVDYIIVTQTGAGYSYSFWNEVK